MAPRTGVRSRRQERLDLAAFAAAGTLLALGALAAQESHSFGGGAGKTFGAGGGRSLLDTKMDSATSGLPRINIFDGGEEYEGVDLTDEAYWQSLVFVLVPGVAIALLCIIFPILFFIFRIVCCSWRKNAGCCPAPRPSGHTQKEVRSCKGSALFFCGLLVVAAAVIYAGSPQLSGSLKDLYGGLQDNIEDLGNDMKFIVKNFNEANRRMNDAEDSKELTDLSDNIDNVIAKTEDFEGKVESGVDRFDGIMKIVSYVIPAIAIILFLCHLYQVRIGLFFFILLIPILAAAFWICYVIGFGVEAAFYDISTVAQEDAKNPGKGTLGQYIPCPSKRQIEDFQNQAYQAVNDLVFEANEIIAFANVNTPSVNKAPLMCRPYEIKECPASEVAPSKTMCPNKSPIYPKGEYKARTEADCPDELVQWTNFGEEYDQYVCENDPLGDAQCLAAGKILSREQFERMDNLMGGIPFLLKTFPVIDTFAGCKFATDIFDYIGNEQGPKIVDKCKFFWIGFLLAGASLIPLWWITLMGQARYKGFSGDASRKASMELTAKGESRSVAYSTDGGYLV